MKNVVMQRRKKKKKLRSSWHSALEKDARLDKLRSSLRSLHDFLGRPRSDAQDEVTQTSWIATAFGSHVTFGKWSRVDLQIRRRLSETPGHRSFFWPKFTGRMSNVG